MKATVTAGEERTVRYPCLMTHDNYEEGCVFYMLSGSEGVLIAAPDSSRRLVGCHVTLLSASFMHPFIGTITLES